MGPSYKQDVYYDKKINNGLNSVNSILSSIKVYKIKAKIILQNDEMSEESEYWYNPKSGIAYDIEFEYPIGKISKVNNIPTKLNANTYLIDMTIDIPTLKRR